MNLTTAAIADPKPTKDDMFSIMCMCTIHAFDQETALQFQYDPQKKFSHL